MIYVTYIYICVGKNFAKFAKNIHLCKILMKYLMELRKISTKCVKMKLKILLLVLDYKHNLLFFYF